MEICLVLLPIRLLAGQVIGSAAVRAAAASMDEDKLKSKAKENIMDRGNVLTVSWKQS